MANSRDPGGSDHQGTHGVERAAEGVEDEAEDLERHDAEEGFRIARLAQDDGRVAFALREREPALRDRAADDRPVGEAEVHLALRREPDGLPHRLGEERVDRSTVDQEAHGGFGPAGTADGALDVADTHAPEYGPSPPGPLSPLGRGGTCLAKGVIRTLRSAAKPRQWSADPVRGRLVPVPGRLKRARAS